MAKGEGTGEGPSRLPPVLSTKSSGAERGCNLLVSGSLVRVPSTGSPRGKNTEAEEAA